MMNTSNMNANGFTIIELMIVVALIGIISALALPLFGNYSAKAQLSEGQALLAGLKSLLVEAVAAEGIGACDTSKPWFTNSVHQGHYVNDVAVQKNTTQCLLTVTFKSANVNDKIIGKKINIRYTTGSGVWECGTDLPSDIAPSSCPGTLLTL